MILEPILHGVWQLSRSPLNRWQPARLFRFAGKLGPDGLPEGQFVPCWEGPDV